MAQIKDLKRMCDFYSSCKNCLLNDEEGCSPYCLPDNIEEILDNWVKEHPVKTYAQDFFEKFPNAQKNISGEPVTCLRNVYGEHASDCLMNCIDCWNQEMKENA